MSKLLRAYLMRSFKHDITYAIGRSSRCTRCLGQKKWMHL